MLVGTKQRLSKCRKINIRIENVILETVEVSKLLGVNIDCCLAWSNHLEILANKISKKLGVLKRLKPFMSGDALLKVYNCIIFPHFNYCYTVWSGAKHSSNIDRLLKLEKRAARIILNVSEYSFSKVEMDDYFVYRKCILTYKVLNNLTPEYLNVFQYVSQVSSRITRQSVNNLLFVPKAKTEYYRCSFVISSCNLWNLWNNMSNEMRESTSLEIFKTKYLNE